MVDVTACCWCAQAVRLEDTFWDLDWRLYEMQWERIEWRLNVLDEQVCCSSSALAMSLCDLCCDVCV